MMVEYSTDRFVGAERFAYWRDVICDAYLPIHCESPDVDAFDGQISLQKFDSLNISHVTGSPQHVSRTRREIAKNSEAYFMLSLQLANDCQLTQRERAATLQPGDFALYSTSEPYEIVCRKAVDQLIFQIPCDQLSARLTHADTLTGCRIDGQSGIGAAISANLRQYAEIIGDQPDIVQRHLQDLVVDLVATGLSSVSPARVELSRPHHMLLARAKSTIRTNLHDPNLDRAYLSELMGMSARNLSRCFEQDGEPIAAYIRRARLEAIAQDLTDPRMALVSISEISMKWGITNFQHLSKLFRQTYGMSPRDYRKAAKP